MGGVGTEINEAIKTMVFAVLGGSGMVGLLFFFLRLYLEKRLNEKESEEDHRKALRIRRMQIEDELHHCYGRVLFWLVRFAQTGHHNGELDNAFAKLEKAEAKKKELDREIIADSGVD